MVQTIPLLSIGFEGFSGTARPIYEAFKIYLEHFVAHCLIQPDKAQNE